MKDTIKEQAFQKGVAAGVLFSSTLGLVLYAAIRLLVG